MRTNLETLQNRRTVPNTSNQSLLWDGIDLPFPDVSKSTIPQPDINETFQIDFVLEDSNQFLAQANELLRHYDKQVIREREKFIREIENKNKGINRTEKPTAHSSFQKELRNHEKSEKENMEERNEISNKQSVNLRNRRRSVHQSSDTDDSEPLKFRENSIKIKQAKQRFGIGQPDVYERIDMIENHRTIQN